jgi:hypothetical protein
MADAKPSQKTTRPVGGRRVQDGDDRNVGEDRRSAEGHPHDPPDQAMVSAIPGDSRRSATAAAMTTTTMIVRHVVSDNFPGQQGTAPPRG